MDQYIYRLLTPNVLEANKHFPVALITGPRQSGKTTLCRHLFPDYSYANLDDVIVRMSAMDNPVGFVDSMGDCAVIDEVHHVPELLTVIQDRVSESPERKYILTSRSNLLKSQDMVATLGQPAALFTLLSLSLIEAEYLVAAKSIDSVIIGGMYPQMIADEGPACQYYRNYYNIYMERDLRDHISARNLLAFDRFIRMMAMRIGSEFNASAFAREIGVSSVTIKEWFSVLTDSYIAFPLMPYQTDLSKPQSKMPKVYFYDTGLAAFLLGIDSEEKLRAHQMRAPLFENLAVCELIKNRYNRGNEPSVYFFRDKSGLEVDAVTHEGDSIRLYEITPGHTVRRGFSERMKKAKQALGAVASSTVIYEGESLPPVTLNIREI